MTAAFTFPGQGSQAVGMGKGLAEAFPAARAVFEEVDAALGEKLTETIWSGPADVLQLTENAQPALMAVSLATLRALEIAKIKGAKRAMLLPVSAPFHCTLMQPAADVMAKALAEVAIRQPASPLVSNVLASPITDPDEIRRRLIEQVTGTVRWRESIAYMAAHGVTRFFEIGAGKVLSGLVKRIADGAVGVSIGGPNDIAAAKDALAAAHSA